MSANSAKLPTISVLTTCHRRTRYLDGAIRSVLAQSYPALEMLIIEDNPPYAPEEHREDGAPTVLRRWNRPLAPVGEKLAFGFAEARGDLVALVEDDDAFLPTKLERVARTFAAHPTVDFLRNGLLYVDSEDRPIDGPRLREVPEGFVSAGWSALSRVPLYSFVSAQVVRRATYRPYFEAMRECSPNPDVFLYWALLDSGGANRAYYLPSQLTRYRWHHTSQSRAADFGALSRAALQPMIARSRNATSRRFVANLERSSRLFDLETSGAGLSARDLVWKGWDALARLSPYHLRHWVRQVPPAGRRLLRRSGAPTSSQPHGGSGGPPAT